MTREELKNAVMCILSNEKFSNLGVLFGTKDINRYRIAQYDETNYDIEADMPLDEFLDELYEVIKDDNS